MSPRSIWFCFATNKTLESSHCAGSWHSVGGWKGLEGLNKVRLAWILDNDISTVDVLLQPYIGFDVGESTNILISSSGLMSSVTFVIFVLSFYFLLGALQSLKYFHKGKLICLAEWSPWLSCLVNCAVKLFSGQFRVILKVDSGTFNHYCTPWFVDEAVIGNIKMINEWNESGATSFILRNESSIIDVMLL